ncbi:unnamed protein product [Rangifer tarandus platyrhynchus]|uniref:Uncharacterized protein n=1 Tax=Rangifer tarandus platyrhynchus TaxID=3082113 RepID=A0AC59YGM8_RANTA
MASPAARPPTLPSFDIYFEPRGPGQIQTLPILRSALGKAPRFLGSGRQTTLRAQWREGRGDGKSLSALVPILLHQVVTAITSAPATTPRSRPVTPPGPWHSLGVNQEGPRTKLTDRCYPDRVNRPLGILSPAWRGQERSEQQLTSLPRVQPRTGARVGVRAPGMQTALPAHVVVERSPAEAISGGFKEEAAFTLGFEECVAFRSLKARQAGNRA